MFSNEPEKLKEQRLVEQDDTIQDGLESTVRPHSADSGLVNRGACNYSNSENSLVGKTIGGHYKILSLIGTGGMSAVYEANHLLLAKTVAIKIISAGRSMDEKVLMRFQQEAKAATSLNHPNIASVSEFGQDTDGSPFLVMEYVKGKSLAEVIKEEGKLSYERSVAIMLQLCDALHYAHERSVIHRDIKPANIILTRDASGAEVAKIVDFGIAKILSADGNDLTQTGEVFGTPSYMSPEQCCGKPVDRRTDIYSLGCVLEEMLSGNPPFTAGSTLEMLMMHMNETPAVKHSAAVNEVILRALEKEPADRFQTAKEMAAALCASDKNYLFGLQSQVPSRRKTAFGLLVGVVLSLLVICVLSYCFSIAQSESQQYGIAFVLLIYVGTIIQLLMNHYIKKR